MGHIILVTCAIMFAAEWVTNAAIMLASPSFGSDYHLGPELSEP